MNSDDILPRATFIWPSSGGCRAKSPHESLVPDGASAVTGMYVREGVPRSGGAGGRSSPPEARAAEKFGDLNP